MRAALHCVRLTSLLLIVLLGMCSLSPLASAAVPRPHARAQRSIAGRATASSRTAQPTSRTAPDALGSTIVVWEDTRGPWGSGVFAQKLDASGAPQWTNGGVPVCITAGYQRDVSALSDGMGGAYVLWENDATDDGMSTDIYIQHLDADGGLLLASSGMAVCDAVNRQMNPQMVSSGTGGALVVWEDRRPGLGMNVYAQLITLEGIAAWTANGEPVCTASGDQVSLMIVSDGADGAIIAWTDLRNGEYEERIFAQRVDRYGAMQWATNGLPATSTWTEQWTAAMVSDGNGGAIVAWGNFDTSLDVEIHAQRFSPSGATRWGADGVVLCAAAGVQYMPLLVSDGANGAIAAWVDSRDDSDGDYFAQRVDSTGAVLWAENGVAVCQYTTSQSNVAAAGDGAGGAFFVWRDQRSTQEGDLYGQYLNASGAAQWTVNGAVLCGLPGYQFDPEVQPDGAGGALVTWFDTRARNDIDLYAQRFDASGLEQWTANGVGVHVVGVQGPPAIAATGNSTSIVAWAEKRLGQYDIRARKLDANGAPLWDAAGVCTAIDQQIYPALADDGAGGAIVAWLDYRAGTDAGDLYAQRLGSDGSLIWPAGGICVFADPSYMSPPAIVGDGHGGAILVWEDNRSGVYHVWAQRLNGGGTALWAAGGVRVCGGSGEHGTARVVADGEGGAFIVFQENPSWIPTMTRVQHLDADGGLLWGADGVALNSGANSQASPTVASDGDGGAICTWSDDGGTNRHIRAQRVRSIGALAWGPDGVAVATPGGDQDNSGTVPDGAGGAVVMWQELAALDISNIRAQRVDSTGAALWTAGGKTVCDAANYQMEQRLVSDGAGGAIVCWTDFRNGTDYDVYADHLDNTGGSQWLSGGKAIADTAWNQWACVPVEDGAGGVILAWMDCRTTGMSFVRAQHLSNSGSSDWGGSGVVGTQLSLAGWHVSPGAAHLEWYAANGAGRVATVYRRTAGTEWHSVATISVDGTGLLRYDDRDVTAGGRYAYRVGVAQSGSEQFSADTWVEVPLHARLELAGVRPNPVSREFAVSLALAGSGAARLELLDVAGRAVRRWALGGYAPGEHVITLGDGRALAPGVYVLRLVEGGERLQRRITIVR